MPEWTFEERYGRLFRSHGVGTYPNALGEFQARLGLSGDECWLIVRLFSYRWTDRAPYPSERRLAKHMGIARSTVQRIVRGLEAKGLIEVERRTASSGAKITSLYRLEPLLRRLEELVDEESRSVAIAQRIPRFGIVSTLSRSALPSVAEQQILPLEEGGGPPAGHPRPTCGPPPAHMRATPGPPVLPHGKDSWEEEEREEESWQRAQANTSDRPYLAIAGDVVFRLGCLSKTASVERGLSQRAHAVGASPEQVRSAAIRAVSEQRREEGLDGFWHTFARILSEQIARPEGPKRKAKASAEA